MTNEEVRSNLEKLLQLYDDGMIDFSIIRESIKVAISALGAIDQYKRERDIAVEQLKELGYQLGEKQRTGVWLIRRFGADAQCSVCGMRFSDVYDLENSDAYCRHCGLKMKGLKVMVIDE